MNKNISISISIILFSIIISIFIFDIEKATTSDVSIGENVEIIDDVQYITINARGGYFPKVSEAKSGIPTKLIMRTDGTYDCSSALFIRSIDYQNILEPTGEEIIDLGKPVSGKFQGMCSMAMYWFTINFN